MTTRALTPYGKIPYPPTWQMWGAYRPDISNSETETYEPGLEPAANGDGSWTYTLPASSSPLQKRRLERRWAVDGRTCTHTRGDIVVLDADFTGVIGAAASDANQWHLIWQLHGPGRSDFIDWRPPPVSMGISEGHLWFEGGEGHPNMQYTKTGYHKWRYDLGPWVDNERHHIRIELKVGNDPDCWVSCWFDGVKVCEKWRPRGYWPWDGGILTNNYPGTIFSAPTDYNGDWVQNRSGLYRGTKNNAAGPTYVQWMRWWPYEVAPAHKP